MFDGNLRESVDKQTRPIGEFLTRLGVSADVMTLGGVVCALGAALVISMGHLLWGFVAVGLSSLPDLLDGPVAKASGSVSKRGAFLDSLSDRISDLLIFGGLSVHFLIVHKNVLAVLSFAIYGAASIISYERAKGESLGFDAKGGLMERAERLIAVLLGLAISPLLVAILWLTLIGTVITAIQRFLKIWSQASTQMEPRVKRHSHLGNEKKWRTRRISSTGMRTRASTRIRDARIQRTFQSAGRLRNSSQARWHSRSENDR